jgi:hypothetical protein
MQHMANLMMRFKLIEHNKISGLIDDSFANAVDLSGITDITSIFQSGQKMTSLQGNIKPNPLQ